MTGMRQILLILKKSEPEKDNNVENKEQSNSYRQKGGNAYIR